MRVKIYLADIFTHVFNFCIVGNAETGPLRWFLHDGLSSNDESDFTLRKSIADDIKDVLIANNPFWHQFKLLSEQSAKYARLELSVTTSREIAAILVVDANQPIQNKVIVCWRKTTNDAVFIDSKSPLYLPLQYILICPCGTPGWDIEYKKKNRITQLSFYRQLLLRHKPLHMMGPLLNEYMVDFFSTIESERLDFLRSQQKYVAKCNDVAQLLYWRNDDSVRGEGEVKCGRVYLSSEFLGSPRHQQKMVADSLAIVKKFGNPTFFITMTTNPKWEEILEQLGPGQTAADRPDVVVRVFKGKLQQLFDVLPTALRGGHIIYRIHVIEFQKRGIVMFLRSLPTVV